MKQAGPESVYKLRVCLLNLSGHVLDFVYLVSWIDGNEKCKKVMIKETLEMPSIQFISKPMTKVATHIL